MTSANELQFFLTSAHPCGYLENEISQNIIVDPYLETDGQIYSLLSSYGFRRSGDQIYRPQCEQCQACVPIRVRADDFQASKSQRRVLNKNKDLIGYKASSIDTDECYALYERYIRERHSDGEMYPPSREQFKDFLKPVWGITEYLLFRDTDQNLVSVAVTDVFSNGLSAMYSFFDPDQASRSLGIFNVLYQILLCQSRGLPFLYLGYWIKESQKMSYKTQYRPYELFKNNQWIGV